jgi:hypothetical protein
MLKLVMATFARLNCSCMKNLLVIAVLLIINFTLSAQIKINEVYGGGGNASAPWRNDFLELYNPTASSVSLAGWSVQYASSTGTSWGVTNLTGAIAPNGYYLIQLGSGGTNGVLLPTPDVTGTTAMNATGGKVILCNVTTAQTGANPIGAAIVDKVGYGSANGFEGTAPATAPSNTTSVQRTSPGLDTDNNVIDFAVLNPPTPTNGMVDVIAPTINTLTPANASSGAAPSVLATIVFSEVVQKGTGTIVVKQVSDNAVVTSFNVTAPEVTLVGNTVTFLVQNLQFTTGYYIEMSAGGFVDNANNSFAGIVGSSTWSFTVTPVLTGTLSSVTNFATCANHLFSGFTQYSVTGAQLWACTSFGRDAANPPTGSAPNGLQINGFSGTNIPNEDWLISPAYNLVGTNFPLLSFWSRTRFNGDLLKLKVSTNYPGTGNPNNFTWVDVNGKFPKQTTDVWTLSENINLSAYKTANTYFAFVYTSSIDDGARWTVDDITITNSAVAPPASLTVSTSAIQFGFAPSGGNIVKSFTVIGNDIIGDITITASPLFTLSTAIGGPFTNTLTLTQASANNTATTVYVRYAPTQNDVNNSGQLTISTPSVTDQNVTLSGTSLNPLKTLEVVNWNIEWFGSTVNGPTNEALQQANTQNILQNLDADVYALAEIVDESKLATVVSNMPGYAYVISNFGSHTNPNSSTPSPLAEAQKMAYVYKTSVLSNVSSQALLSQGINSAADISNPAYNYYSSGRFPFMLTADVTLNGITKNVRFVLVHAKANTSPTLTSYNRRKNGSDTLRFTLNNLYPTDNIIVLGDLNDDLDETITDGIVPPITSWSAFVNDNVNFAKVTLPLSIAGRPSTVGYTDMIDHVIISNEMNNWYINNSANVLDDVTSLVTNFGNTTSDHYPVFTRYTFEPIIIPVRLVSFTAARNGNAVDINWRTENEDQLSHFVVERKTSADNWVTIHTVNARGGSNATDYATTDATPVNGVNQYRLKSVDRNGEFKYSPVKTVRFEQNAVYTIYPNPASSFVQIQFHQSNGFVGTAFLVNQFGQNVQTKTLRLPSQQLYLPISQLANGVYWLKLVDSNGSTQVEKIVKQ